MSEHELPAREEEQVSFPIRRLEILRDRVIKHVATCQEAVDKSFETHDCTEEDEMSMCKLELVLESFESELKDHSKVTNSPSVTSKLEEFLVLQGDAQELLASLKVKLRRHATKRDGTEPLVMSTARLPKLNLEKFDGNVLKWCTFWDSFSANVDKRGDLADVDKFSYLMGSLEGEARRAIDGLRVTNLNYKIAIDELTERFGAPDAVIDAHYIALRNLVPAGKSANDCRTTLTEIEQHLRVLEALGEPVDTNNQLRSTIMEKFPDHILYHLKMTMKTQGPSIPVIRKTLKDVISANESGALTKEQLSSGLATHFTTDSLYAGISSPTTGLPQNNATRHCNNSARGGNHNRFPVNNRIPTSREKRGNSDQNRGPPYKKPFIQGGPQRPCRFCGGGHYNDECSEFTTLEERLSRLKDSCRRCFQRGHWERSCPRPRLVCAHCKETSHHRSLCPTRFGNKPAKTPTTTLSSSSELNTGAILQTATARVSQGDDLTRRTARLLFDSGSQKTYITSSLARQLNLRTIDELYLSVYTFGHTMPKNIETRLVTLKIHVCDGFAIDVLAHVIPSITGMIPAFASVKQRVVALYPERKMASDSQQDCPADVLIGIDHYHSFFTGMPEPISDNLYIVQTKLGWILSGSTGSDHTPEVLSVLTYVQRSEGKFGRKLTAPDPPLKDDTIKDLWELECIGIRDSPKRMQDDEIVNFFNSTIQFLDGRYFVKWPWSQKPTDLPINYGLAYGRLKGLLKRTDSTTLQRYDDVIQEQLSLGIIELVPKNGFPTNHPTHYLPHHCVVQENKTTKLRIVYDASAKRKGSWSLNEYLHKGPLLLEDLVSLLMNFRVHAIGVVADIEKAFLQIGLMPEDRDVTRFLWLQDINQEPSEHNTIHLRFCRVPFGIVSSPFLLAATVKYHLTQLNSAMTRKISGSLYVDNLVTGVDTTGEACTLFREGTSAFEGLSMNLREWGSNCHDFLSQLPEGKRTTLSSPISVLGVKWDTDNDTLMLAVEPSALVRPISSKREILSVIASIYDPCGLAAPLLLPAKLFLQNLWIEKYKWDTPLSVEKIEEWARCAHPLTFIPDTRFPRHLFGDIPFDPSTTTFDLHCFTDASMDAYSTVIYVVRETPNTKSINLLISRTRLVPIKHRELMTIPKKELLGVLIGTRLTRYVRENLRVPIHRSFLWTDSKVVLGWLRTDKLLPPFVSKRVAEINSCPQVCIRYVPSVDNSADVATRPQFEPLPTLWLNGPTFLTKPRQYWPMDTPTDEHVGFALPALVEDETLGIGSAAHSNDENLIADHNEHTIPTPPRTVAGSNPPHTSNTSTDDGRDVSPLEHIDGDVEIGLCSEKDIIRRLQRQHFPLEVEGKTTALARNLGLFKDDAGVLRCTGRLQNAGLSYDQTHPILLPRSDDFTFDTIRRVHVDNHHVGASHTLALLRRKYWVPQGRVQVNYVLKRCALCIKHGGGPYKLPPMPPLPPERVRLCTPFTYVGLDYLGPLLVLDKHVTSKRWICIFTCMATRAIRLEVVQSMSAEEFLLCLRRFVALQGTPLLIVSDNAAQFKLIAEILQAPLCARTNLSWHFIPELSPWQGGFYERLVGLIKHCLRRSIDKRLLTDTQLATLLREIETILNTRPLTYVGNDLDFVLTPADFLSNCGTHPLPGMEGYQPINITATRAELLDGWKRGRDLIREFSSMFKDRYLANLRERAMAPHRQHRVTSNKQPEIGDIVQLSDGQSKSTNRTHWKTGKITALLPSGDGHIRTAQVTLQNGTVLNRSVGHLYPLELDNSGSTPDDANLSVAQDIESRHNAGCPATSDTPNEPPIHQLPDDLAVTEEVHTPVTVPTSGGQPEAQTIEPANSALDTTLRPPRRAATLARNVIRRWTEELANLAT